MGKLRPETVYILGFLIWPHNLFNIQYKVYKIIIKSHFDLDLVWVNIARWAIRWKCADQLMADKQTSIKKQTLTHLQKRDISEW